MSAPLASVRMLERGKTERTGARCSRAPKPACLPCRRSARWRPTLHLRALGSLVEREGILHPAPRFMQARSA